MPVVYRDVPANGVPEALAKLNWIFFREQDEFNQSFQTLLKALDTDLVAERRIISWESTTEVGESARAVALAAGREYLVVSRYNSSLDVDTSTLTARHLPEKTRIYFLCPN